MIEQRNRFIRDVDLNEATSLTHLLDRHDREEDVDVEIPIIKHSPFNGESKFADLIKNNAGLSILDLNIQNVYSKFDELICFVQNVNTQHPISAICLNECWISQENDTAGLHIEGYNMFFQRGNRVSHGHCGLIIYIHETFLSQEVIIENVNTSWDYLCVQLSHSSPNSKKYLLCNVYRLPCFLVADIDLFTTEFSSFLRSVKHSHSSVFICGDFNIQTNHRLHLLQKKAVRIITNKDYIAHTEPLCKLLNILKATDLFKCSLWKFYYKLTNGQLPAYFDIMLPILPNICNNYSIRLPTFHLPLIKHAFAVQRLDYQLIRMLNDYGSMTFTLNIYYMNMRTIN